MRKFAVQLVLLFAIVGHATAGEIQSSLARYIQDKVKGGNPVADIVCKSQGKNPKSDQCFDDNAKALCNAPAGQCPTPCNCWLTAPPVVDADSRFNTWSKKDATWNEIKAQLNQWAIPNELLGKYEMATMFEEKAEFINFHYYVQADSRRATYQIALGAARTFNGVTEIGYIFVKTDGILSPFYRCGSTTFKKKGIFRRRERRLRTEYARFAQVEEDLDVRGIMGRRRNLGFFKKIGKGIKKGFKAVKNVVTGQKITRKWCNDAAIPAERVDKIRLALQYFAFDGIRFHRGVAGGSGRDEDEDIDARRPSIKWDLWAEDREALGYDVENPMEDDESPEDTMYDEDDTGDDEEPLRSLFSRRSQRMNQFLTRRDCNARRPREFMDIDWRISNSASSEDPCPFDFTAEEIEEVGGRTEIGYDDPNA